MSLRLLLLLLSLPLLSTAQKDTGTVFFEAGLSPLSYKGDLSHSYQFWGSGFHLGLKMAKNKLLHPHFNLMFGSVSASDPFYEVAEGSPNKYFKSSLISFNFDLQINLINHKLVRFYLGPGIGVLHFTPKNENQERLEEKISTRAPGEELPSAALILPLQAGIAFYFPGRLGVGIQAGWLNSLTDYIDNIAQLGNYDKKDNLLLYKFYLTIPLNLNTGD